MQQASPQSDAWPGPAAGNMHFSIPETESRSGDSGGSAYVVRSGWSRPGRGGDNGPEPCPSGLRGLAAACGAVPGPPTPDGLAGSLCHVPDSSRGRPSSRRSFCWAAAAVVGVTGLWGIETATRAPGSPGLVVLLLWDLDVGGDRPTDPPSEGLGASPTGGSSRESPASRP